jgi:VWFA-related protein
MSRFLNIYPSALAGLFGGAAAWAFVLTLATLSEAATLTEILLGAVTGLFIGGFLLSRESITGRQAAAAFKRGLYGALAGAIGGAAGAALGSTIFTVLGRLVAEAGGFRASLGVIIAICLGWSLLGACVGVSSGIMIRSRERAFYGLAGGGGGGLLGGFLFYELSATSVWSALAGLALLGMSIGAFISLVEEAFVSAKLKVIKGRHLGREFSLLKEMSVVGRDDRSDVCLSGAEGVNVRHALITRKNGHYSIETDTEGKPVYVNQKMTTRSSLTDGDVIRVGSVLLMFTAVRKASAGVGFVLALLLGPALLGASPAYAEETPSVQITQFDLENFPQVKAYVSILDRDGKPVPGLGKESISLFENGQPVAVDEMRQTSADGVREPLSLAIVLDRSESMTGLKIDQAREAVRRFISLMNPTDRASLIAFSDTVQALASLTSARDELSNAVTAITPGGHTALFDAIIKGVQEVKGVPGRRAVVVLTDGIANRGAFGIDDAISTAVKDYVSIYVIGLGADVRTARLERIAEDTGGFYFFTPDAFGLAEIYENISRRIRGEYLVTFDTERRAEYLRNVSLVLGTDQRAQRAYFQPASSLFGAGGPVPGWAYAIPVMSVVGLIAVSSRKMDRQYRTGHLSVVRGRDPKKDMDIAKTITIGKGAGNTLDLSRDSGVARQHAEVLKENGRYIIEDRGSGTGTFVNKKRITGRMALHDGDVIDVGNTTMVFSSAMPTLCQGCGDALRPGAKFCPRCGVRTAHGPSS